jgi:haloacetate dehalogenase
MFDEFSSLTVETDETTVFVRTGGTGPAVLLLHGFPETHLMWRDVAPVLARSFTVVCADLRGYGRSGCPPSSSDHAPYSKRAMARDMVSAMRRLGFDTFAVVGHDRGGRVAYRLALDHPKRVEQLVVLDIVPTEAAWARANAEFAVSYWPWIMLAQDEPLPEAFMTAAPEAIIDNALGGWGSPASVFPASVRGTYADALRGYDRARAICEEYRAAASIDREHDRADLEAGRRIACPTLALWSAKGPLSTWYSGEGGPIELWRPWCDDVRGQAIDGGHFFPEEAPDETARLLSEFLAEPNG